jgi:hypothetical protein
MAGKRQRQTAHVALVNVPIDQLHGVKEMDADGRRELILWRIRYNLALTGHPFHHRTADVTIVDSDPTLTWAINHLDPLPAAVPVNRLYYGFDLYASED